MKSKYAAIIDKIETTKEMSADDEKALAAAIEDFKKTRNLLGRGGGARKDADGRIQGNPQQDQERAEHAQDHQGDGDGRGLEDEEGPGPDARGAPLRRARRSTSRCTSRRPTPSTSIRFWSSATR